MTCVAWRLIHGMLGDGWTWCLLGFKSLDTGLLISANDPDSFSEQSGGMFVQVQDWSCPLEELFRVLNVLPRMETPGAELLVCEPTPNRPGRDRRQGWNRSRLPSKFGSTPMTERNTMSARQAARERGYLCAYL